MNAYETAYAARLAADAAHLAARSICDELTGRSMTGLSPAARAELRAARETQRALVAELDAARMVAYRAWQASY
jgi:hypothetical protein